MNTSSSASPEHYVVALGGGIASGKSAVAAAFAAHGVACYDADTAARAVVMRGEAGLAEIVAAFGNDVITADGELDRAAMRRRVFGDDAARKRLEAIVHPRVRTWLRERVAADTGAYCLLAIPLLAETWPAYDWVDRVLIVDVDPQVQFERLVKRDSIDAALAQRMIAAQATREARLAIADDVVDNSGSLERLKARVDALHARYFALAGAKRHS
jgi:dephospho-CoA kinase